MLGDACKQEASGEPSFSARLALFFSDRFSRESAARSPWSYTEASAAASRAARPANGGWANSIRSV